jgi:hypothetical protein
MVSPTNLVSRPYSLPKVAGGAQVHLGVEMHNSSTAASHSYDQESYPDSIVCGDIALDCIHLRDTDGGEDGKPLNELAH